MARHLDANNLGNEVIITKNVGHALNGPGKFNDNTGSNRVVTHFDRSYLKGMDKWEVKELDQYILRGVMAFDEGDPSYEKQDCDIVMQQYIKGVMPALTNKIEGFEHYYHERDIEIVRLIKATKQSLGITGDISPSQIDEILSNDRLYRVGFDSLQRAAIGHKPVVVIYSDRALNCDRDKDDCPNIQVVVAGAIISDGDKLNLFKGHVPIAFHLNVENKNDIRFYVADPFLYANRWGMFRD